MKSLFHKTPKPFIADLPVVAFQGRIVVVISESEAERAVDYLLSQPVLGIDTETRPIFKRGKANPVALLQVSAEEVCFLFRLNVIGMCPAIVRLLEDTRVLKVGLSLHDDLLQLRRRKHFKPGLFVDLQSLAPRFGIEDTSLRKLTANFFHQKLSKREQLSNWEAECLGDRQKTYAATDAWICILLYREMTALLASGDYEVIPEEAPAVEPETGSDI